MLKHIKNNTLHITDNNYINTICIQAENRTIYTEVVFAGILNEKDPIIFKKMHKNVYEYKDFHISSLIYTSSWFIKTRPDGCYLPIVDKPICILYNYLKKIIIFLEVQSWYVSFNLLPLLHDIIKYTGLLFIDYHQLYNIKVK